MILDRVKAYESSTMVPNINTRMLIKELKNMEANGIVIRKVFATVPPTVEYTLTTSHAQYDKLLTEFFSFV